MKDYFQDNKETVARDITRMMGKPIVQSREELDCSIDRMRALMDLAEDALKPEIVFKSDNITKSVIREAVRALLLTHLLDWNCTHPIIL
jgi:acyl-CoA reductase-like NAD-dependent aldehyde dehydrogenase